MIKKVNERLNKVHGDEHVSYRALECLLVNGGARAGRFYLLPNYE